MPNVIRRDTRRCPRCTLVITIMVTDEGTSFEYDITDWVRVCRHPDSGSPLACPSMRPLLQDWFDVR